MSRIADAVEETLIRQLQAIRYNLKQELSGLLYSLKLELDKQGDVGLLDELIDMIISTSEYTGSESGEEYPVWLVETRGYTKQEVDKIERAQAIKMKLAKALLAHGIEQHWNIGNKALQQQAMTYDTDT